MGGDIAKSTAINSWLYNPTFPTNWAQRPLHSLAEWINGLAFRDIQFSQNGMPVIKIAELKEGITGQTKFTNQTFADSVRVRRGDLLFSWSGQPETSIDVFWWQGSEGWLNQHTFRVTPIKDIEPAFFYYLLRYLKPNFIGIARNKQTTGLGHVTKHDLERLMVSYPGDLEQRAIARILGTLDDKIEINHKMKQTLEEIAQALFKSWFVDFEPVRAKAKGRDTGLPPHIAALFPDSFEDSVLGKIPEGWGINKVGKILELRYGKGLKETDRNVGDVPVYGSNGQVGWHNESLVKGPGIVVGRKGNAGTVTWAPIDFYPIDTTYYVEPLGLIRSLSYLFYALRLLDLPSLGADSAVPGLNRNMAYLSDMLVPPAETVKEFDRNIQPIMIRIHASYEESQTLASLRDTLLPKLISGQLRIKDAEKYLEKAL